MQTPHKDIRRSDKYGYSKTRADTLSETPSLADVVIGPNDDDPPTTEDLLEQYNFEYILDKVKRKTALLSKLMHRDVLDLELEIIAEEVYVHFWQKLLDQKEEPIRQLEAYLARMINNRCCDAFRQFKRSGSAKLFSMLEGEALHEENALIRLSLGMDNPALEYDRKYGLAYLCHRIAFAISRLPKKQKLAMTCWVLERVDNMAWMMEALTLYGVNIDVQWPPNKEMKRVLEASLPAARKSVANYLNLDISAYVQAKRRSRSPIKSDVLQ